VIRQEGVRIGRVVFPGKHPVTLRYAAVGRSSLDSGNASSHAHVVSSSASGAPSRRQAFDRFEQLPWELQD
jgi:hypothetical protein